MYALMMILMFLSFSAWSETLNLAYGVNRLDINADGTPDMILRTRRDNFTAHSFDRYTILVTLPARDYPAGIYEVPISTGPNSDFHTTEGADCLRTGYTFERDSKGILVVTRYMLKDGDRFYCESTPLTVTTYKLTSGTDELIAPYYMKQTSDKIVRKPYDDVSGLVK
jgi:hypothetical protein